MRLSRRPMENTLSHPKKKGSLQTMLVCLLVCGVIIAAVGAIIYFLNQDNEVMPDATPANPVEHPPPPER